MPDGIFKWSDGLTPGGSGGTDEDAIHDNVSGEINAVSEKVAPHDDDIILIEDSEVSYGKKKVKISNLPGSGSATDENAIHDNVSGEIAAITEKLTVAGNDIVLIEDSEATNAKKKVKISEIQDHEATDPNAIHDNVNGEIAAITEKVTPHVNDMILIEDSEASNAKKYVKIENLPAGSATDANAIHKNVAAEISTITEKTEPVEGDWFLIEDAWASTQYSKKKVNFTNIKQLLGAKDGWIPFLYSMQYVSSTQIATTGVGDFRSYFPIGTKIKFVQTTVKYFTVTDVTYSTYTYLTLTGDTVISAAISGFHYSHALVADGMPNETGGVWQDWTPTQTNLSGGTLNYARYTVIGKFCSFVYKYTLGGAGVGSTPIISLPLTAAASMEDQNIGNARFDDVGTRASLGSVMIESTLGTFYLVAHNATATYSYLTPISGTIPHTWANTDRIRAQGIYEIA